MPENKLVQCPRCGSLRLNATYDDSGNGRTVKRTLLFGPIGLAYSLLKEHGKHTYWQCMDCGFQFPMD
jgi:DNA-directed RNA polymerase subunit RPC12/RpoP